jgi:hypothetical protein
LPVGIGIGATQVAWAVMSPIRAAGRLPTRTVVDATLIIPGPAGTQLGNIHGWVISVVRALGWPPISTLG